MPKKRTIDTSITSVYKNNFGFLAAIETLTEALEIVDSLEGSEDINNEVDFIDEIRTDLLVKLYRAKALVENSVLHTNGYLNDVKKLASYIQDAVIEQANLTPGIKDLDGELVAAEVIKNILDILLHGLDEESRQARVPMGISLPVLLESDS